jgi:hypothetical protein
MFTNLFARMPKILAAFAITISMGYAATAQYPYPRQRYYEPYPPQRYDATGAQIEAWYQRYLHRSADPTGLQAWGERLRNGEPRFSVEAGILGSDEYFQNHGNDQAQFIRGLFNDVLGRRPARAEVGAWLDVWDQVGGNRERLARRFLREVRDGDGEGRWR